MSTKIPNVHEDTSFLIYGTYGTGKVNNNESVLRAQGK